MEANEALLCKHVCLVDEARVQAVKLASMHVVDLREAQGEMWHWPHASSGLKLERIPQPKRDPLLKKYLGSQADTEESHALFCMHNSLTLSKGLLYMSTIPKGEMEGVLAFLVPSSQCTAALNGIYHDAGHQSQQQTLALDQ